MARRCKCVVKRGKKLKGPYRSCRERPVSAFDSRSLRTKIVRRKGKRPVAIVIGCPRGKWSPSKERCKVGTRAQRIDRPVRSCPR